LKLLLNLKDPNKQMIIIIKKTLYLLAIPIPVKLLYQYSPTLKI
jgi:hypothetical protein